MKIILQRISQARSVPTKKLFNRWINETLKAVTNVKENDLEVTIRIVDQDEITSLNRCYRKKDEPTNVLAFFYDNLRNGEYIPTNLQKRYLGDIVVCAPFTIQEAKEQKKTIEEHFAHLTVHGALHLLGHDHKKTREAKKMEKLEVSILSNLGYKNPYHEEGKS